MACCSLSAVYNILTGFYLDRIYATVYNLLIFSVFYHVLLKNAEMVVDYDLKQFVNIFSPLF